MNKIERNTPELWISKLPQKQWDQHKYDHGHALIHAAPKLTGATNLAAQACARIGTGLVTVATGEAVEDIYRCILPPHVLVRTEHNFETKSISAKLYGPGGLSALPDYHSRVPVVLDADALSALPGRLAPHYILTPHHGEFDRAFPDIEGNRTERAKKAANTLNCIIVLKGPETLIVSPNGHSITSNHASPWLATVGSGDVLAGMIAGLAAQNMHPFDACCAAVWIHGECALHFGRYLVASDLPDLIPSIMNKLLDDDLP